MCKLTNVEKLWGLENPNSKLVGVYIWGFGVLNTEDMWFIIVRVRLGEGVRGNELFERELGIEKLVNILEFVLE